MFFGSHGRSAACNALIESSGFSPHHRTSGRSGDGKAPGPVIEVWIVALDLNTEDQMLISSLMESRGRAGIKASVKCHNFGSVKRKQLVLVLAAVAALTSASMVGMGNPRKHRSVSPVTLTSQFLPVLHHRVMCLQSGLQNHVKALKFCIPT